MRAVRVLLSVLFVVGLATAMISKAQSVARSSDTQKLPWADITAFGGRAFGVKAIQSTAFSVPAQSTHAYLTSPIDFQNGDGIAVAGAGATNTQPTPLAPAITSRGATGSATYEYQCVGYDKTQGLTAASVAGTTTSGLSEYPVGGTRVTISSISREANGVVRVATSSPHHFQFNATVNGEGGTIVVVLGAVPNDLNGWYVLSGATDSTFTYVQGLVNLPETATTPGTATVFGYNRVTCPAQGTSGPTVGYYIYGRTAGAMKLIGKTLPFDNVFNDYGPGYTPAPSILAPAYVPSTPPGEATHGIFSTTIVEGGGTQYITLATPAVHGVKRVAVYHDTVPAILSAMSSGSSAIYFPPAGSSGGAGVNVYPISSPLKMPRSPTILLAAPLLINETISLADHQHVSGYLGGSDAGDAFGKNAYVSLLGTAYPQVIVNNGSELEYLRIRSVLDVGSWMLQFRHDYFDSRWAGSNSWAAFNAIDPSVTGTLGIVFQDIGSVSSSPAGPPDIPMGNFWFRIGANGQFIGQNNFDGRGILLDARSSPGWPNGINNGTGRLDFQMQTGSIGEQFSTPIIMRWSAAQALYGFQAIDGAFNSDSTAPLYANWATSGEHQSGSVALSGSINMGGCPNLLTGNALLTINGLAGCPLGQNFGIGFVQVWNRSGQLSFNVRGGSASASAAPSALFDMQPVIFPTIGNNHDPNELILWQQPIPAPSLSLGAGGSLKAGTSYTYFITPIGYNNLEGTPSAASTITPTSENRTVLITYKPVPGARGYNVYRDGGWIGACFTITTLNCTDTGGKTNGSPVNVPGTGMPILNSNEIGSTLFTLYPVGASGAYNRLVSDATTTRTNAIPDANGNFCLVSACPLVTLNTAANCSSSTSPALCGSAPSGSVTIPAGSSSVTVNTTAVTARSQILVTFDSSLNTKLSAKCNTAVQQPYVRARTPGKSFTIAVASNFSVNPGCFNYLIVD